MQHETPSSNNTDTHVSLPHEARDVLGRIRNSLAAVLGQLPDTHSAAELADLLGINRKLGWQVWRLAFDAHPLRGAGTIPGNDAFDRFFLGALGAGASQAGIDDVLDAIRSLDTFQARHAGDRASLMHILRSLDGAHDTGIDVATRRASFRAARKIWGIEVGHYFIADIFRANDDDAARVDNIAINGLCNMRRLRSNAPCIVRGAGRRTGQTPEQRLATSSREFVPLWTPEDDNDEYFTTLEPLLPPFCSQPIPEHYQLPDFEGQRQVALVDSPLGKTGDVTLISGQIGRATFPRYARNKPNSPRISAHFSQPVKQFHYDFIVQRSLFPSEMEFDVRVYSEINGAVLEQASRLREDELPIHASLDKIGQGLLACDTASVPSYVELLRWCFLRAGWDPETFDVYRVVVDYPVCPSSLVMSFDLPKKP